MASQTHIEEPPIFGHECFDFSYWKALMENYLKTINVWHMVQNGYVPIYEEGTTNLTENAKKTK